MLTKTVRKLDRGDHLKKTCTELGEELATLQKIDGAPGVDTDAVRARIGEITRLLPAAEALASSFAKPMLYR